MVPVEETICMQCGDAGFSNALVYCVRCLNFAVHRYCLDEIPQTFDEFVPWLCDDCGEMERKQFLAHRLDSGNCFENETTKNVEAVVGKPSSEDTSEESYSDLDEMERCQENSSQQPEEEKAVDIVLQDSNLADDISLKDMFNWKKRKCTKLLDQLDSSKLANLASDSKPQTKHKLNKDIELRVKRCVLPKLYKSNADVEKTKFPSVLCNNGSLKSSKKKKQIVTSIGASAKDQMCRIGSIQSLQKNEVLEVQNQDANMSTENRNVGRSKSHIDKKYSDVVGKKTPAPYKSCTDDPKDSSIASLEPVVLPVWRGSFDIRNKKRNFLEGLVALLSGKACQKVSESASQLQPVLHLEKLPKSEVWPKSFETTAPTSNSIALYFFPTNIRSECDFDILVKEMMQKELALKASVHNAELLIFPSTELPLLYWRIDGKHYLWGVFRGK